MITKAQKTAEVVVESMAKVGYQAMYDLSWDELSKNSIERALWLIVASSMLNELRRLWQARKQQGGISEED